MESRLLATPGRVYLVGAGPGDPKLITVKGLEVLSRADVVAYDHLVSERLLDFAPRHAQLIYVGKEKKRHTKPQRSINRLLIRLAKAGHTVVRLKGGDPVLFGRGGEEALELARANVPYEIVPGVTSAIAVPAYAGIPVTHRQLASSVAMITGHENPTKPAQAIRWDRLATATDTLVCLMGVSTLAQTARQLIKHGRAASTPCAVIEWGTLSKQRTVTGTLSTIASGCRKAKLQPPAIFVVGEVVKLRRQLNWFERKPLFGARIVVTRPSDRAPELANALEDLGAEVIVLPAIELTAMHANGLFHQAIREMDRFDWVFFTSPEGIQWFRKLLSSERRDLRILRGRHIGAIGPKTASSITDLGIHVDFVPTTFSQEGMVKDLGKRRSLRGKRALILGAKEGRDVLEQGLKRSGMDVLRVPIYQTVKPAAFLRRVREVFASRVDLVTATSASCVEHVADALPATQLRQVRFASIGPVTSDAVKRHGGRVAVEAKRATIEGLVDAIASARLPALRNQGAAGPAAAPSHRPAATERWRRGSVARGRTRATAAAFARPATAIVCRGRRDPAIGGDRRLRAMGALAPRHPLPN